MVCQKCQFAHANPIGCISCGWVFDPNYHPDLGAAPTETAEWILAQSIESLERLYGAHGAQIKLAIARQQVASQPRPDAPSTPPPTPKPRPAAPKDFVESIVARPVQSPFASRVEPTPEPEPAPEMFANEAPAPVLEPEPEPKPAAKKPAAKKTK